MWVSCNVEHLSSLCRSFSDAVFSSFYFLEAGAGEHGVESFKKLSEHCSLLSHELPLPPWSHRVTVWLCCLSFAQERLADSFFPSRSNARVNWKSLSIGKCDTESKLPVQEHIFLISIKHSRARYLQSPGLMFAVLGAGGTLQGRASARRSVGWATAPWRSTAPSTAGWRAR